MLSITCIVPSTCTKRVYPYLSKCISSLYDSAKLAEVKIFIIVVTENRNPVIGSLRRQIGKLLSIGRKVGFAKMNNFAIKKSLGLDKSDYYLLINDDAWVDKFFFKVFKDKVKGKDPDIFVPLIYASDGKEIDSFGIEYFTSGYARNALSFDIETTLAPAACVLIKSSFLRKMKRLYGFYFNEILHSYLEDVELSIRAKALGGKIVKERKMKAYHVGSLSFGKKSYFVMYQTYRNILWLILLTWPFKNILKNILSIILVQGWVMYYSTRTWGPKLYLKVVWETFGKLPKLLALRKRILSCYSKDFNFQMLFSKYAFRTYHGITIKI